MAKKIMMFLGGAYHDFEGYEKAAVPLFSDAGYVVEPTYERDDVTKLDGNYVAVVAYTSLGGVKDDTGRTGEDFTAAQAVRLREFVTRGGGLLGVHSATVIGEPDSALHKLYGGRFIEHPPKFRFSVYPTRLHHPVTEGIGAFVVFDEFYIQDVNEDCVVLMTAFDRGVCHSMVWVRAEGAGRVACLAPGHDQNVWEVDEFKKLSVQALDWVAAR